jgi:hypothetical protein
VRPPQFVLIWYVICRSSARRGQGENGPRRRMRRFGGALQASRGGRRAGRLMASGQFRKAKGLKGRAVPPLRRFCSTCVEQAQIAGQPQSAPTTRLAGQIRTRRRPRVPRATTSPSLLPRNEGPMRPWPRRAPHPRSRKGGRRRRAWYADANRDEGIERLPRVEGVRRADFRRSDERGGAADVSPAPGLAAVEVDLGNRRAQARRKPA